MTAELIGIIAASIALGGVMLAALHAVRHEVRDVRQEVRDVRSDVGDVRTEMGNLRTELRDEMQAGFKELTARVVNIGDRLSKVEGIIEGMFWGARNQPPDKPRQGAA